MSKTSSSFLSATLLENLRQIRPRLAKLDCEGIARQVGFLIRDPRKIPILDLVLAFISTAGESKITLERLAKVTALVCGCPYSKQALQKRLNSTVESLLMRIAAALMVDLNPTTRIKGLLSPFKRVLLHDSTCERLPDHLAPFFPGSKNQRKATHAMLKIQFLFDLLSGSFVHSQLAGFTRNDQTAASDVLDFIRPGDLLLRDLGYFNLSCLESIAAKAAFFLSRYRHGVSVFTLEGQPLDLVRELRKRGSIDQEVLLGSQKVKARLVAQRVPQPVGNERRRRAKAARDQRSSPSQRRLILMDWNIFVTNVDRSVWPAEVFVSLYRLRWRVEMIFKAWKSYLGLREFNSRNATLLRLTVMAKLLYCLLVVRLSDSLESLQSGNRHVSLLRVARMVGQCGCLVASVILGLSPKQWLTHQLDQIFYEQRSDRSNFFQLIPWASS